MKTLCKEEDVFFDFSISKLICFVLKKPAAWVLPRCADRHNNFGTRRTFIITDSNLRTNLLSIFFDLRKFDVDP